MLNEDCNYPGTGAFPNTHPNQLFSINYICLFHGINPIPRGLRCEPLTYYQLCKFCFVNSNNQASKNCIFLGHPVAVGGGGAKIFCKMLLQTKATARTPVQHWLPAALSNRKGQQSPELIPLYPHHCQFKCMTKQVFVKGSR